MFNDVHTTTNNPGGGDTQPAGFGPGNVAWGVCRHDDGLWRAYVTTVTVGGNVNITNWPAAGTPTLGAGGTVTAANWRAVVADLGDYDAPGGGAGPVWHSTAATTAHENHHWNTDWMNNAVQASWPAAEAAIEAHATAAANAAAARAVLTPLINADILAFHNACAVIWNATNDTPGAGSGAYAAGNAVLQGIIANINAHAAANGWP